MRERMPNRHRQAGFCICCCLLASSAALALPTPDHLVIVIEENEAPAAILGSADAPYINSLAAGGASFASFYSVAHPSQPNYLQFYSGANQGITGDGDIPPGVTFSTPNLGANLIAAGKTFAGYFEDLPAAGSTVSLSGKYVRRHNPVVDWQSSTPGPNQYGTQLNQPLTSFPTDFNQLPTVSYVIPNSDNDMHDKPIAVGDAWLKSNLDAYAQWAKTHNSLLIVTWDEDNFMGNNRVATIIYGQGAKPSQPQPTWTHHNLLRTIEDMYGAAHAGASANVRPIVGPFDGDVRVAVSTARDTAGGYSSTIDTYLDSANPNTNRGSDLSLQISGATKQGLIRFDNIWGFGAGQAPVGARILSAKLLIQSAQNSTGTVSVHRMLIDWNEASTWNSLLNGVSANDVEAVSAPEFTLSPSFGNSPGVTTIFDVTQSVAQWSIDPSSNKGWLLKGSGTGWPGASSEGANPPALEITYERTHWNVDANGAWANASNWISGHPIGPGAKAAFLRNITAPRTITMPPTHTVGAISFESDIPYTLAGTTLNLAGLSGVPTSLDVVAGSHIIAADVNFTESTPINIAAESKLTITGLTSIASGTSLAKSGDGTFDAHGGIAGAGTLLIQQGTVEAKHFNGFVTRFAAGGHALIKPDGTSAASSKLPSLEFDGTPGAWQGQFDLTNNSLIIQADAATRLSVLNQVADQIATARNSRPLIWTGEGITSSFAANSGGIMGLAVLLNDNGVGGVRYATFAGLSADLNSVLVKYTLVGDMDLDGDVDADDYSRIDAGFAQRLNGYWNGDLDYNGRINADDFFAMDRAFSSSLNQPAGFAAPAAVPEPAAAGFSLILAGMLCLRLPRASRP
jgi:hypothetical protein